MRGNLPWRHLFHSHQHRKIGIFFRHHEIYTLLHKALSFIRHCGSKDKDNRQSEQLWKSFGNDCTFPRRRVGSLWLDEQQICVSEISVIKVKRKLLSHIETPQLICGTLDELNTLSNYVELNTLHSFCYILIVY